MIVTPRLKLRAFTTDDAPEIERLAGAREVAYNTLLIPHPYPSGAASEWISGQDERAAKGNFTFAVEHEGKLVGVVGLHAETDHNRAEIGYWIGVPYWGNGYATEAAGAVVRFGFEERNLNRIFATVFSRNPPSARVLQKIGLRHEGTLRQHIRKWDEYIDVEMYAMVRGDWTLASQDDRSG